MKMHGKVFLVFCLSLIIMGIYSISYGQEWKAYFEDESGRLYFDNASIERLDSKLLKVWYKETEKQTGTDEIDKFKSLIEINCAKKIYRVHAVVEYDTISNRALPEQRYEENQPWIKFSLDSKFGALYDNICP